MVIYNKTLNEDSVSKTKIILWERMVQHRFESANLFMKLKYIILGVNL